MTRPSADILTITLNPALDMSTSVDAVRAEEKLRCDAPVLDPGGGGINVARAICQTGGTATAFVALAGFRGQQLASLLEAEAVPMIAFPLTGETRFSLAVSDRQAKTQFRFVMPGPGWTKSDLTELSEQLTQAIMPGMHVVLSGSHPPGVPDGFPKTLADITRSNGAKLTLDTSGAALLMQMTRDGARPDILRLDGAESEALAGRKLTTLPDVATFARDLVANKHAHAVVLALGADGSVLATGDEVLHAVTPPVPVASKVGAGDSFVGAFTKARAQGGDWAEALRHGTAAASAAVMSPATELCRVNDLRALLPQVTFTKL
ncbi:1-phosphofructokinase family hexose kinase [Aliiroseovarius sp. S1339]|uniref:1-phosphofructokinase family hexose kinase n=1 Tax=Aliiroseovarius sp. S1339 TaxID=2936990 RepID=UPI0020BD8EF5|nr:1-phosphofructokinase family hexose kinase [Aliiroseovarius sp. S1339]MCK8465350.1 1-phosphofructokinase family hexose kinase [Aliiroseovarius sp. S1339]